mgnify:CR=1 FL=1
MSASSPALKPRATPAGDAPPAMALNGDVAAPPVAAPKGPMSAFLKPKGVLGAAAPKPSPIKGKAPAVAPPKPKVKTPPLPVPKQTAFIGMKPPTDAPQFMSDPKIVLNCAMGGSEATNKDFMDKLYVSTWPSLPLTSVQLQANLRLLPVVLWEPEKKRHALLVTQTSDLSPLGGGVIYIVTAHGVAQPSALKPLTLDETGYIFNSLHSWSPGHQGAASPQLASLLWRLKATFKNFEWETVNVADLKAELDKGAQHVDVVPLSLSAAPPHVLKDYDTMPIPSNEDKDVMKKAVIAWTEKGTHWTPPEGKWPCFPVPQHDPRAGKLGSRCDLAVAVGSLVRSAVMPSVKTAFPNNVMANGVYKMVAVEPKKASPPAPVAEEDDEEAETQALLAPPKPREVPKAQPPSKKEKKEKKAGGGGGRGRQPKISGLSFIDGMAAEKGDDEDESDGEEDEDGFIASDDDVDEAGSTASARKKRQDKTSRKRRYNMTKNVVSDDDGSDDDGEEGESSEEDEMSEGGSDVGSEDGDDSDDDVIVKPGQDASEASDLDDDDDDEDDEPKAKGKRLVKNSKKAQPPKKKSRVRIVDDDDDVDEPESAPSHAELLAKQRLFGQHSAGSKPLPKMGATLSNGIKKRHESVSAAAQEEAKERRLAAVATVMVEEPEAMFTPTKENGKGPAQPPGAPGPAGAAARAPRNDAWKARNRLANAYININKRCEALYDNAEWDEDSGSGMWKTKPGSIVGLAEHGAVSLANVTQQAKNTFEKFREDRSIDQYNEVVEKLLCVTGYLTHIIETADSDEKTRKRNDNANAELGAIAAQSLLKVVPQIEALQKAMSEASGITNTLVGTSAGMASRIAQATAKKDAKDGK